MEAVAHNPAFARKAGVPQSVGQEFAAADEGKAVAASGALDKRKKLAEALRKHKPK